MGLRAEGRGCSLVQVLQGEGLCGEADVAVTVEPHSKWVPVGHQEPLPQDQIWCQRWAEPASFLFCTTHLPSFIIMGLQSTSFSISSRWSMHMIPKGKTGLVRDQARASAGRWAGDYEQFIPKLTFPKDWQAEWVSLPFSMFSLGKAENLPRIYFFFN